MSLPVIPTVGGSPCLENRCSACCHDTEMLLSNDDVLRLSLGHADEPFWHEDDGFLQLSTRDGPPVPGHEGRKCWFLADDGRCTVHDDRPAGCRLYPAIWDDGLRRVVKDVEHCPHTEGFRLPTITQDAVRRLVDVLMKERDERQGDNRAAGSL